MIFINILKIEILKFILLILLKHQKKYFLTNKIQKFFKKKQTTKFNISYLKTFKKDHKKKFFSNSLIY